MFFLRIYGSNRCKPLDVSFEQVAERLQNLPRMYFEMDGSFVWVGNGWQLDGMLYDAAGILQYVELKGCCTKMEWALLIASLLGDDSSTDSQNRLAIHSVDQDQWFDHLSFRNLLANFT